MVWGQWTLSHFRRTCYISPEKVSSTTENAAVLIIEWTSPVRQDWTGSGWPTTSQSNMTPWLQLQPLTKRSAVFVWVWSWILLDPLWFMCESLNQTHIYPPGCRQMHHHISFLWGSLSWITSLGQDRMGLWYTFLLKSVGTVNSFMVNVFRMSLRGLISKLLSLCISAFKRSNFWGQYSVYFIVGPKTVMSSAETFSGGRLLFLLWTYVNHMCPQQGSHRSDSRGHFNRSCFHFSVKMWINVSVPPSPEENH